MICNDCGSTWMRPSHLRLSDLRQLFNLKLPVRCRHCMSRSYVPFWRLPSKKKTHRGRVAQA
jgi:hypothetical protein